MDRPDNTDDRGKRQRVEDSIKDVEMTENSKPPGESTAAQMEAQMKAQMEAMKAQMEAMKADIEKKDEELKKKDEELKKKDEEIKKKDEELIQKDKVAKANYFFFTHKAKFPLLAVGTSLSVMPSGHRSKHREVDYTIGRLKLSTRSLDEFSQVENAESRIYHCLADCQSDCLQFQYEATIADYVVAVMRDVLRCLAIPGIFLSKELQYGGHRPDIWVIKNKNVPIGYVQVKRPTVGSCKGQSSVLDNRKVLGQIYNYMMRLKNSFGVQCAFGIVSTYKSWRFCWLPDADVYAETGVAPESDQNLFNFDESSTPKNELHGTSILSYEEGFNVALHIATVAERMVNSPIIPPLNTENLNVYGNRAYLRVCPGETSYQRLSYENAKITFADTVPGEANAFFYLCYLGQGVHGSVWLCCDELLRAYAIKFYRYEYNAETTLINKEEKLRMAQHASSMWKKIYGINTIVLEDLDEAIALVMPYYHPWKQTRAKFCGSLYFNDDAKLESDVAAHVKNVWIGRSYGHNDIAYRNIARKKDGKLLLIDLDAASINPDEEACKTMLQNIENTNKMLEDTPSKIFKKDGGAE